jgi:hypothetical protein
LAVAAEFVQIQQAVELAAMVATRLAQQELLTQAVQELLAQEQTVLAVAAQEWEIH